MAASLTNTGVQFPNGVTQTGPFIGARAQFFTSSGTFTVPDGVTAIKVSLVGGGGSAGVYNSTTGAAGGTTSFGAYCSATGGSKGGGNMGVGPSSGRASGGTGSGGDINWSGGYGGAGFAGPTDQEGAGGGSMWGIVNTSISSDYYIPGMGYFGGNGGSGGYNGGSYFPEANVAPGYGCGGGATGHAGGGGGGGGCIKYITGLTPGTTISVTIGAGGVYSGGKTNGGSGACLVEW